MDLLIFKLSRIQQGFTKVGIVNYSPGQRGLDVPG